MFLFQFETTGVSGRRTVRAGKGNRLGLCVVFLLVLRGGFGDREQRDRGGLGDRDLSGPRTEDSGSPSAEAALGTARLKSL